MPSYLQKTLRELPRIGTFENIVTATLQTSLTEALNLLIEARISALPIVDKKNKVIDVYAKFDVIVSVFTNKLSIIHKNNAIFFFFPKFILAFGCG